MPRGFKGDVKYLGWGKFTCPECGKTKFKKHFVSRRNGVETMNWSRCNSCEYKRYGRAYWKKQEAENPNIRNEKYKRSPAYARTQVRAEMQRWLQEQVATFGITIEQIMSATGSRRPIIRQAMEPNTKWSWKMIRGVSDAVRDHIGSLPEEELDRHDRDSLLSQLRTLIEQSVEARAPGWESALEGYGDLQEGGERGGVDPVGVLPNDDAAGRTGSPHLAEPYDSARH
jgi:hypothetical protein